MSSDVLEPAVSSASESTSVHPVTSQRDDVSKSVAEVDDSGQLEASSATETSGRGAEDTTSTPPTVVAPGPACEPVDVGGPASSACIDEQLSKDADKLPSPSSNLGVDKPLAAAEPGDDSTPTGGDTPSNLSRAPSQPPSTSTARHSLPSAVAAPRPTGKHRLPPVMTTSSTGQGHGHGLERVSPLSLVVGSRHPFADSVRASASLTGGTRLGDLGLSQPPPLNLSVAEQAVNMKVASTQSTVDTAGRVGTSNTMHCLVEYT